MKRKLLTQGILAASVLLGAQTQAAEIRMNGFVSIGAGKAFSQGTDNVETATSSGKSRFTADAPSKGNYEDNVTFKPDSIYGVQFSSNLGDGLSVTGQITGAGGEEFEANLTWAYVSYDINDSWTVQAGRQRIPLFFYSDFLDVGYAYHWMRPPTETNLPIDSFDGIKLSRRGSLGNWDSRAELYAGSNQTDTDEVGLVGFDNIVGGSFYVTNDWLQLRATHLVGDFWVDNLSGDNLDSALDSVFNGTYLATIQGGGSTALAAATAAGAQTAFSGNITSDAQVLADGQGEDKPVDTAFSGLAAHATLGNAFIIAEYTVYEFDKELLLAGWKKVEGAYISAGYRIGSLTPHITFSVFDRDLENYFNADPANMQTLAKANEKSESITVGLRWDFHPAAAMKFEYQSRSDKSDQTVKAIKGDYREIDVFTAGIDIIF